MYWVIHCLSDLQTYLNKTSRPKKKKDQQIPVFIIIHHLQMLNICVWGIGPAAVSKMTVCLTESSV